MVNTPLAASAPALPEIRHIGFEDLKDALARGVDDFLAMPSLAVFLCLIYPVVGLFLGRLMFSNDVLPLVFPLVAGFALVGPFAAIGLYELSRRRELGLDSSWEHAFDVLRAPARWSMLGLGVLFMLILFAWLGTAQWIYAQTLGQTEPASPGAFFNDVFATQAGWTLLIVGNGVGFLFALLVFVVGVVSFPLLLDRDVSAAVAMLTSARAVIANPVTMAAWGLIVAAGLVIGSLPFLLGLAVVMPVLGHASWHLYRKVVE